jgi:hypothetical protein
MRSLSVFAFPSCEELQSMQLDHAVACPPEKPARDPADAKLISPREALTRDLKPLAVPARADVLFSPYEREYEDYFARVSVSTFDDLKTLGFVPSGIAEEKVRRAAASDYEETYKLAHTRVANAAGQSHDCDCQTSARNGSGGGLRQQYDGLRKANKAAAAATATTASGDAITAARAATLALADTVAMADTAERSSCARSTSPTEDRPRSTSRPAQAAARVTLDPWGDRARQATTARRREASRRAANARTWVRSGNGDRWASSRIRHRRQRRERGSRHRTIPADSLTDGYRRANSVSSPYLGTVVAPLGGCGGGGRRVYGAEELTVQWRALDQGWLKYRHWRRVS